MNPAGPVPAVTDQLLAEAHARADAAAARLGEVERSNPARDSWGADLEEATAAVRATSRRVEALEQLRAAQVERSGKRAGTVKAAAGELTAMAAGLSATRDAVAAAAAEHLRTLAALRSAVDAHNQLLARSRDRVSELGLRVRDDLVDVDTGQEHAEGILGRGIRAGGVDWIPIPPGGVEAHALRLVFADLGALHPLARIGKYQWRSFEVEQRPDGLKVPGLKDAGAVLPPAPPAPALARPAQVPPAERRLPASELPGGYYPDPPVRRRERTITR